MRYAILLATVLTVGCTGTDPVSSTDDPLPPVDSNATITVLPLSSNEWFVDVRLRESYVWIHNDLGDTTIFMGRCDTEQTFTYRPTCGAEQRIVAVVFVSPTDAATTAPPATPPGSVCRKFLVTGNCYQCLRDDTTTAECPRHDTIQVF